VFQRTSSDKFPELHKFTQELQCKLSPIAVLDIELLGKNEIDCFWMLEASGKFCLVIHIFIPAFRSFFKGLVKIRTAEKKILFQRNLEELSNREIFEGGCSSRQEIWRYHGRICEQKRGKDNNNVYFCFCMYIFLLVWLFMSRIPQIQLTKLSSSCSTLILIILLIINHQKQAKKVLNLQSFSSCLPKIKVLKIFHRFVCILSFRLPKERDPITLA